MATDVTFSVSARTKPPGVSMEWWVSKTQGIPIQMVDSVFGFFDPSPIYGGRPYRGVEITERDVTWLYDRGIGIKIPATNTHPRLEDFEASRKLLDKYHRDGNVVAVVSDRLRDFIRMEYPKYKIELGMSASTRKGFDIERAIANYDTVALNPPFNDLDDVLLSISDKSKVRLFARSSCEYFCSNQICRSTMSKVHRGESKTVSCNDHAIRRNPPIVEFDVGRLMELGFSKFKVSEIGTDKLHFYKRKEHRGEKPRVTKIL